MNKSEIGSKTAKGGFANEREVCKKFNEWKKDSVAQEWLRIMGYDISKIKKVQAIQIPTRIKRNDLNKFGIDTNDYENIVRFKKADVQISIFIKIGDIIKIENLSLKKANSDADYNQVDKRKVDDYKSMWRFDNEIAFWLKLFTGEFNPRKCFKKIKLNVNKLRDKEKKRLFLDEMPINIQNRIINFFEENRIMVISDLLKGRGGLSANWLLVTRFNKENKTTTWKLVDINMAMNFFGRGEICISPRGSLYIGKITMQRKSGTPDPTKLQFKIKPCQLFELGV